MKSTKTREAEDGTQTKISAFFKKPGTERPQSKLFSSIGVPSLEKKDNHQEEFKKSTDSKGNSKGGLPVYKGTMESCLPSTVRSVGGESEGTKDLVERGKSESRCLTILKDMSASSTAVYTTPQKSVQDNPNLPNSPEVVIIPDTPEHRLDQGKGGVRAKTVCRSFLRPVSLVTTMPGKKVVFSSSKQKRVQKKSSGYVSVQFRGQGTGSIVKTSEGQMAKKSSHEYGESDEYGFYSDNLAVEGQLVSMTTPEIKSDPQNITDNFMQTNNVTTCLYQIPENAFKEHVTNPCDSEKQASTPKKLYSDGKNIKRMAKSGISPVSKRATSNRTEGCGTRVICAKRQLVAMAGFTDVKEMNKTVNSYQITGSSLERPKDPAVTCKDDSILVELLEELSPFVMAHQSVNDCVKDTQSTTASVRKFVSTSIHKGKKKKTLHSVSATDLMENGSEKPKKHACSTDKKLHQQWDLETTLSRTLPISSSVGCLEYFQGHVSGSEISSDNVRVHKTLVSDTVMDEEMQHFKVKDDNLDLLLVSLQEMGSTNTDSEEIECSKPKDDNVGMFSVSLQETGLPDTDPKKVAAHLSSSTCNIQDKVAENLSSSPFTDLWNRCIVCAVSRDPYTHELHLELAKVWGKEMYQCILQEFWVYISDVDEQAFGLCAVVDLQTYTRSDTHIESGDTVNIVEDKDQSSSSGDNVIIVNNISGQIVVNPDLLLSGTTIVSGVHCLRRSILNEKFKGLDGKNNHMLYGSVIHSLFQEAVKNRLLNTDEIMSTAERIAQSPKFLHEMYGQGVSEAEVLSEVQSYIEPLRAWQKQYMYPDHGCNSYHSSSSEVSVVKIHDIEETIWSPRYGIKGKIDMTVEVKIQKGQGEVTRKVLPLELKTGKTSYSVEHTGQVTLYSIMMSDRRDDPKEGLLLYLKQPEMKIIPVKPANKQGLLQLRNEMAYYIRHQTVRSMESDGHVTYRLGPLPEPINNFRTCSKCPQLLTCTIFQRAVEDVQLTEDHAMQNLVPSTLSHLSSSHLQYFTHWFLCMQLENAESNQRDVSGVWRMSSKERENQGDCLQQMVIANTVLGVPESQTFTDGKGCCVRFQRKAGYSGCTISAVGIHKNDSVVISSEDGRLIALSTGFVKDISEDTIEVVVDRDSFHDNRDFLSEVFRIDRCETYNTASYLMSNLARLMEAGSVSQKLRSLIIDKKKPEFNLTLSKVSVGKVKKIFQPLNKPQKTAVLKVLMAKDYVLIKGYPGTGKTSTIVGLVKILRELGHSVLLTSYTHSAVDNILLKLKEEGVRFLRLGRSSRVHPDLQNHVAENLTLNIKSLCDLKEFYNSYAIVATSCLGTNHPVFQQRKFDVCLVDEASQVVQPACLGPLFYAEKFVLVGDPNQLPPVVQSTDARSLGMEESLFTRLDGTGATYELSLQYRMNRTIVHLANNLVYNGALQCGSPLVAQATVQFVSAPVSVSLDWMRSVLDSSLTKAVVFLDTSQISAPEISDSRGIWNKVEASIIVKACNLFVQAGISACDIGVIAPYRSQVQHLRKLVSGEQPLQGLEINTVDQYQGRDKSVICISFVRSCAVTATAGKSSLLQDVRRLNVAVTRAQHKLVLIGNAQTLSQYQPLQTLLNSLQERQQIISLPADTDSSVQPEQNM